MIQSGVSNAVAPAYGSTAVRRSWVERGWWFFTALVCAHFSLTYNVHANSFIDLPSYTQGMAELPYQPRVLMAWVFRLFVYRPQLAHIGKHLPANYASPFQIVMLAVSWLAIFGAVLATRGSLRRLTGDASFSKWASLLVVFMAYFNLPLVYGVRYTLPYDVPSLFFFCCGVYLLISRKYWLFYPIFILGTLNRETVCFLVLFYIAWEWFQTSRSTRDRILHILPQAALMSFVWIAVKAWLWHRFRYNHASHMVHGLFQMQLFYDLKELVKPQQWPLLLSNFGFALPLVIVERRWIQNPGITAACAVIFPLWLALMLVVGVVVEIRIFDELNAFISIATGLILYNRWVKPAQLWRGEATEKSTASA